MRNESVWKAGRLHIFTEGAVEMKEWRFTECSEGCGLANRQFFEVAETRKLKSLQKIRGGERFYDSVGLRGNTKLKMSSAYSNIKWMYWSQLSLSCHTADGNLWSFTYGSNDSNYEELNYTAVNSCPWFSIERLQEAWKFYFVSKILNLEKVSSQ